MSQHSPLRTCLTILLPCCDTLLTNPLRCSITAILISRFLLELQEADQTVVRLDADDPLHSSRDPYDDRPSCISSLGAFINPDLPVPRDNDSELFAYSRSDPEEECRAQASESQTAASLSSA